MLRNCFAMWLIVCVMHLVINPVGHRKEEINMTIQEKKEVGKALFEKANFLYENWFNKDIEKPVLKGPKLDRNDLWGLRLYALAYKYEGDYRSQFTAPYGREKEVLEAYGLC